MGLIFLAVQPVHTFKMTNYQTMTHTDGTYCYFTPPPSHTVSIYPCLPLVQLSVVSWGPAGDAAVFDLALFCSKFVVRYDLSHIFICSFIFLLFIFSSLLLYAGTYLLISSCSKLSFGCYLGLQTLSMFVMFITSKLFCLSTDLQSRFGCFNSP